MRVIAIRTVDPLTHSDCLALSAHSPLLASPLPSLSPPVLLNTLTVHGTLDFLPLLIYCTLTLGLNSE